MDQKYFAVPFATTGDVTAISETVDPTGLVSFPQGWGPNYARDQTSDPLAIPIDRASTNYLMNVITAALAALQRTGIPEWITPANNDGVALPYAMHATVRYSATTPGVTFETYVSLVDGNTATPGSDATKWQPISQFVATNAQLAAGTDNRAIVTPLGLATRIAAMTTGRTLNTLIYANISGVLNVSINGGAFAPASSSTYTPLSPLATVWDVEVQGAGGAGGGAQSCTSGLVSAGSGGGGGGNAKGIFTSGIAGQVITAGVGGTSVVGAGGNTGGSSSIGSTISATGGQGGATSPAAVPTSAANGQAQGGQGIGGGQILTVGGPGLYALLFSAPVSGCGGASALCQGALFVNGANNTGRPGQGFGAGGSGAAQSSVATALAGGAGFIGCVIIREKY